jgi:post-segregation antitoxin (ccd killing protein)
MATLSLRLPESVHRQLVQLAKAEGVSLNQLLSSAAAEKLAALMTEQYLSDRAKRASRRKFDATLAKIPDAPPAAGDEVPPGYSKRPRRKAG